MLSLYSRLLFFNAHSPTSPLPRAYPIDAMSEVPAPPAKLTAELMRCFVIGGGNNKQKNTRCLPPSPTPGCCIFIALLPATPPWRTLSRLRTVQHPPTAAALLRLGADGGRCAGECGSAPYTLPLPVLNPATPSNDHQPINRPAAHRGGVPRGQARRGRRCG